MTAKLIVLTLLGLLPLGCAQSPKELRTWRERDIQSYLSRYGFKGEVAGCSRMGNHMIFTNWDYDAVWVVSGRDTAPHRIVPTGQSHWPGRSHGADFFMTTDGKLICFDSWPATRKLDQSAMWYAADSGLCEYVSVYHSPQSTLEVLRIDQPDTPVFKMTEADGEDFLPSDMFSTPARLYLFDDRSKEVLVLSKTAEGTYAVVEKFVIPGEFMDMSDDGQWILTWRREDIPIDPRIGIYLFNVATRKTTFLGREMGKKVAFLADDFLTPRLAAKGAGNSVAAAK